MANKASSTMVSVSQALELLNQVLKLEYSMIVHYPRLASAIEDVEIRKLALQLGSASVHHADTVAKAISRLGGTPRWSFEPFPEEPDIIEIFRVQLEKEQTAERLHHQCVALVDDPSLSQRLKEIAEEEHFHVRIVNDILAKLFRREQEGRPVQQVRPNPFF